MLLAENLASIESEGRRLASAVRADPQGAVPQYPGWTLSDLASHTASIHGRTVLICESKPQARIPAPRLPDAMDPIDWFEQTLDEMLAVLTAADPTTPVWAFGPEANIGFWERRMVVETGVHRWDAEQAVGRLDPLTLHVAVSGMDEFPDMWHQHLGEVGPLEFAAIDIDREWLIGSGDPGQRIEGTVSDLYLRLVSRPSAVNLPHDWAAAIDGMAPPPKR